MSNIYLTSQRNKDTKNNARLHMSHNVRIGTKEGNCRLMEVNKSAKKSVCRQDGNVLSYQDRSKICLSFG